MSISYTAIGKVTQNPRGKVIQISYSRSSNQFRKMTENEILLRVLMSTKNQDQAQGVEAGDVISVTGFATQFEGGETGLMVSELTKIGKLGKGAFQGLGSAYISGTLSTSPLTEEFAGNQMRTTLMVKYNKYGAIMKVLVSGEDAKRAAQYNEDDFVSFSGELQQSVENDPLGRAVATTTFIASRSDYEDSESYQKRMKEQAERAKAFREKEKDKEDKTKNTKEKAPKDKAVKPKTEEAPERIQFDAPIEEGHEINQAPATPMHPEQEVEVIPEQEAVIPSEQTI